MQEFISKFVKTEKGKLVKLLDSAHTCIINSVVYKTATPFAGQVILYVHEDNNQGGTEKYLINITSVHEAVNLVSDLGLLFLNRGQSLWLYPQAVIAKNHYDASEIPASKEHRGVCWINFTELLND